MAKKRAIRLPDRKVNQITARRVLGKFTNPVQSSQPKRYNLVAQDVAGICGLDPKSVRLHDFLITRPEEDSKAKTFHFEICLHVDEQPYNVRIYCQS